MLKKSVVITGLTLTCLALITPARAAAASVSILVQTDKGKPMSGVPVSCYTDRPKVGNGLPLPPIFGNLTTSAAGTATWSPQTGDGYTQSCNVSYAVTPDNCYYFSGGTGKFSLGGGDSRSFTLTGKYQPTTCGQKVPETEAEALKPRPTAKPKPTATPTVIPTALPSPTVSATVTPEPSTTVTKSSPPFFQNAQHGLDSLGKKIWNFFHGLFK
jgi:hypothetical protein